MKLNLKPLIQKFAATRPEVASKLSEIAGRKIDSKVFKQAQALIEIADELDSVDPVMSNEADALLLDLVKQAQFAPQLNQEKVKQFNPFGAKKCMGPKEEMIPTMGDMKPAMGDEDEVGVDEDEEPEAQELDFDKLNLENVESEDYSDEDESEDYSNEDKPEIEIEDVTEPEEERDLVSLEDLQERLDNMKFRFTDRKTREALQQAIEYVEKAMKYHDAKGKHVNKVHEIFDNAGLQMRLKDFE